MTNVYTSISMERLVEIQNAFRRAVQSDKKPIFLKLDFPVDTETPFESPEKNGEARHIISLKRTEEYLAVEDLLRGDLNNDAKAISKRLMVAYGESEITHGEFVLGGPGNSKLSAHYKTLAKSGVSKDPFPHLFYFKRTHSSAHADLPINMVTGHVDTLGEEGRAIQILLEKAWLHGSAEEIQAMRSAMFSDHGAYVIARLEVDPADAQQANRNYADAAVRCRNEDKYKQKYHDKKPGKQKRIWAVMEFSVFSMNQLSPAAYGGFQLPANDEHTQEHDTKMTCGMPGEAGIAESTQKKTSLQMALDF